MVIKTGVQLNTLPFVISLQQSEYRFVLTEEVIIPPTILVNSFEATHRITSTTKLPLTPHQENRNSSLRYDIARV